MDSALKAGLVVDVLQEIGLDIDDRAQISRAVEPRLRHIALADQESHLGQMRFEALRRHAAGPVVDHELAEAFEPRPNLRLEYLIETARLRINHDQGSRHGSPPETLLGAS
jgi:hypothetical protein